jgi:imidazolonepropionase-like amidohydrolase
MSLRRSAIAPVLAALITLISHPAFPADDAGRASADLEAARALFDRNIAAIRAGDREGYLACYLREENFARVGPTGPLLGYESHAATSTEDNWPDFFEAVDLKLVPVRAGVVYGSYRYRVRYGPRELRGLSERIFVESPEGWRIAMTSAFQEPPGTPPVTRAFTLATLIDGTGRAPVRNAVVVMRAGRIECAGSAGECPIPDDAEVTPLPYHWITPGLIDAHVHFSQTGYADGRPDFVDVRRHIPYEGAMADLRDRPERLFQSYLCSGVTAVFDVGGYPWTLGLPAKAEGDTLAPHVVAAGPLLAPIDPRILNLPGERQIVQVTSADEAVAMVDYLLAMGSGAVKFWWVDTPDQSPEQMEAILTAAAARARETGLPLIVHATTLERARAAVRAGAKLLVHSVEDQEIDDDFLALAAKSGVVYCPTLTVRDGYARLREAIMAGKAPQSADPLACVDPATRARLALTASFTRDYLSPRLLEAGPVSRRPVTDANLRKIRDAGIPIAMGTDAGNPLTLHGESVLGELLAMQEAGMTPMEVIVAATKGSATAMGRLGDLGTVERGKAADMLVLRADPTESVANFAELVLIVRGGIVRHQLELHAPER